MLYTRVVQARALLHRTLSPLFIYLRDHNQLINPEQSKLNLSYASPANLIPDVPKHTFINFKLDPEMEVLMERQIFEEYKNKVLRGIVDEVEQVNKSLYRKRQTRFGEKIRYQSTIIIIWVKTIWWLCLILNAQISKIASIKSTVDILFLLFLNKSLNSSSKRLRLTKSHKFVWKRDTMT